VFQPYLAEYHYYALFEDGHGMSDVANAEGLYRSIGVHDEQKYRDSYDSYREVSAAELERLRQLADDRGPARLRDFVALDRAHSLIRCSTDGDGKWETFLHEGQWVPGQEPWHAHVLPVGREEVRRISRLRETAEVRYFDVQLDSSSQREIVRHTGSGDEAVDDLGWRPTDVLGRVQPHWVVEETSEHIFGIDRYVSALTARSARFRGRLHDYQAFFRGEDDVYDFGNVLFLARKLDTYELEYERWTPDGWQWVGSALHGTPLPISEEEIQQLAEPRPDERGSDDLRR
jgi:hypothetical protein